MARTLVLALSVAVLLAACGRVCTAILIWGVTVRVTDSRTGAGICDAGVEVSESTFTQRLQALDTDPATCTYAGVGERTGTYRIVVQHPDFATATVDDVVVRQGADGCHVMTEMRTIALQPR